mmetsp:Transcript_12632/g.16431  ORF Transcript_12632/g.16431 Transcript_12632/m.16431 type:complete len:392 (-) Transcript_12632:382-1557(-)
MKNGDIKSNAGMTKENQGTWDSTTQTFHGGQDWKFLSNFICDFSVTTNPLGTPKAALEAARKAVDLIDHYPPSDFEPALSHLAEFLWPGKGEEKKPLLLLGNGASELIDLVIRESGEPGKWRPGPQMTQYKEYQRSAQAAGFVTAPADDREAKLMCIVNPTNPTGDYWNKSKMMKYLEDSCEAGTTVIVDESMQPWVGPHWREDSLIAEREWSKNLSEQRNIHVWIMTSWTKIWSCTGIRLGSVVAPTSEKLLQIKSKQVPWSVNTMALEFLSEVVKDDAYMQETWDTNQKWNENLRRLLTEKFPDWELHGELYLSWVWVDCKDEEVQKQVVSLAKAAGVPVRSGTPGYNLPTFFRVAVRQPEPTEHLIKALESLCPEPATKKQKVEEEKS